MNPETQQNAQFYEAFAPYYSAVYGFLDATATVAQWLGMLESEGRVPSLSQRLKSPPRLLDAGCGPGWFLVAWAKAGFDVTGVDFSPTMLRFASEEWRRNGLGRACALIPADLCKASSLAGLRESFEFVVCHSHLPNLIQAEDLPLLFENLSTCLRPEGIWAFDHSRIVSTYPEGSEEHPISSGEALVRTSSYDSANRRCIQSWRGAAFAGRETYWFHGIEHLDRIAEECGLRLWRRMEWTPNQIHHPLLPIQAASERLLSVYRRP
jgi:SAM-dependent methyltransferase